MSIRYFASDNYAGVHPDILNAIERVNIGHVLAYGDDEYTERAKEKFRDQFGKETSVFFVFNGTAANVTSIAALNQSYQAVICGDYAHIQVDECGAPEQFTGCKLLTVPTHEGKLTIDKIEKHLGRMGDQHHVQPHVISITQSTEYGTVYCVDEIKQLADFAHQHNMYLHMDGARIANAAVSLNTSLRAITKDAGVDVLSFGGTKNGMMFGEAVVFFNPALATPFQFIRKQSMQLASKMRFIAAQFEALLTNDLWRQNATNANQMAALLASKLSDYEFIQLTKPVQANAIFAIIPEDIINQIQKKCFFYVWDQRKKEVRIMTAFDTTEEDVNYFIETVKEATC